jgi:hypothetical protein
MVNRIAEHLLLNTNLYGGDKEEREEVRDLTRMSRIKIAHEALKAAENEGMLPPFSEEVYKKIGDFGHEWEP